MCYCDNWKEQQKQTSIKIKKEMINGVNLKTIIKKFDLYYESGFDGRWEPMTKEQIKNIYHLECIN